MCRECRERFPRHRLHRKPRVSDPEMHHGTCVENVPGIPGACTTLIFTYLVSTGENLDAVTAVTDSFKMADAFAGDRTGGAVAQTNARTVDISV